MYEWAVAAGMGEEARVSPGGVTDKAAWARTRMLEALHAVPDGVAACGWVTVMDFVPLINGYDRYQTPVHAEGDRGTAGSAFCRGDGVGVDRGADRRGVSGLGRQVRPAGLGGSP